MDRGGRGRMRATKRRGSGATPNNGGGHGHHSNSTSSHSHSHHTPTTTTNTSTPTQFHPQPQQTLHSQLSQYHFSDPTSPNHLPPITSVSAGNPSHRGGRGKITGYYSTFGQQTATSPSAEHAPSQRVTPRAGPGRSATFAHSSFSFESPSAAGDNMAGGPSARKRARTSEPEPMYEGNADDEQQSKGGHSLRKRARVDYTQIEDLGPAAFKASLAAKSVVTPNPRSRKKKSATDESHDDPRGSTSSPAPARGGASIRRRNTARKSVPDIPYVAQPVNDDVRDTIMVGVPQDQQEEDQEEDESNQSSFSQDESRPSTSDGSDAVQPELRPEPTTPEPQTVPQVEKAVTLAQDADDGIEKDFVPHQPNGEAEILSKQPPLPLQPTSLDDVKESIETPAALPSERPSETVVELRPASPPAPAPASVADSLPNSVPSAVESDSELQSDKVQEPEPEIKQEPKQPQGSELASIPASDINTPARSPSPEPAQTSTAPVPVLHATKATRAMEPSPAPVLTPKPTPPTRPRRSSQPQRLRNLEKIYHMETPFATQLNLTPYLNEDVVHPGQYTEPLKDSAKDKVETTPMPTPTPTPAPAERGGELKWNARRPLKQSELYALYAQEKKKRQEKGEPPISLMEFHNECARKYKAAKAQSDGGSDQPTLTGSVQSTSNSTSQSPSKLSKLPTLITQSFDETSRSSQQPDSQQPTAAPSPIAPDDDATPDQLDGLEDKQENDAPQGTRSKPDGSADLSEVVRTPPKQYSFPKLRDASQFIDALEDYEDMDDGKLYATCAAVVESMHAIQSEYLELKKILDDEENAKRRRHNDNTIVNWENRLKMDEPAHFRRHFDDTVKGPPVFEVKGVRAPKPYIDDPVLEHQKEEDRIMAQAYGFKHNPYAAAVGRQNPEELRWEMAESRPHRKGTGKAADLAEENVIEGKRMRKPRNFSDQSKDPSRAGTPTGFTSLGRRGKRKVNYAANGDSSDFQESVQITEPEPVPEPVVRKRRGPKPRSERVVTEPEDQEEAAPDVPAEESQPETTAVEEKPKTVRKRRAAAEAPTSAPAEPDENKSKRQRTGPRAQPAMEISSSSFYSNPAATGSAQPEPGSRPSTASSEATVNTAETTESAYSLRDKRKRNFVLENDPELEPRKPKGTRNAAPDAEPKKRGPRRKNAATSAPSEPSQPPPPIAPQPVGGLKAPNVFYSNAGGPPTIAPAPPGPFMHTFNAAPAFPPGGIPPPPAAPPSIKKPITKIKLTNNGPGSSAPSSRAATPANIAPNPKANKGPRGGNKPAAAPLAPADPTTPKIPSFSSTTSDLADKPYAEMSKSEKMSYSMRRRWANGEMQGAVEKRRNTLANKKAEKAATTGTPNGADTPGGHGTPDPTSAGHSANTTPAPPALIVQSHGGPLALPPAGPHPGMMQQPPFMTMGVNMIQHPIGHPHMHPLPPPGEMGYSPFPPPPPPHGGHVHGPPHGLPHGHPHPHAHPHAHGHGPMA